MGEMCKTQCECDYECNCGLRDPPSQAIEYRDINVSGNRDWQT